MKITWPFYPLFNRGVCDFCLLLNKCNFCLIFRNLRRSMLEAAAGVSVPDAIDWAKRTFNAWKDYGTRSDEIKIYT